ncbi:MAG: hypothetical protein ABIG71_02405 [Candidatus Uhrbacteria bacterium]
MAHSNTPLAERNYSRRGSFFADGCGYAMYRLPISDEDADSEHVETDAAAGSDRIAQIRAQCAYFGEGLPLHVTEDGSVFVYDEERIGDQCHIPVTDPELLATVARMRAEDEAIIDAREALVRERANGDEVLAEVLSRHVEYQNGRVDESPRVHDGVTFYIVGRNASHEFYAGAKDGRRFVMSYGDHAMSPDDFARLNAEAQRQVLRTIAFETFDNDVAEPVLGGSVEERALAMVERIRTHHGMIVYARRSVREVEQWGYLGHH